MIEDLVAFNIALLAAIVSPGPALLVAIRTTLSEGRVAGIALGCGLGSMAAAWTAAALLGLEMIFNAMPWAYAVVKTLGAAYLIYIAYEMWRGARNPIELRAKPARSAFRRGLLVNLLNPKSVLFAAAVLVVIFPPNMSAAESALVVVNHLLIEFVFYMAVALAMSSRLIAAGYLRLKVYLDRAASVVLGALGVRLLVSSNGPELPLACPTIALDSA